MKHGERLIRNRYCLPLTSTWVHPVCYEGVCVYHCSAHGSTPCVMKGSMFTLVQHMGPPRVLWRDLCLLLTSTWVLPVCYERVCVYPWPAPGSTPCVMKGSVFTLDQHMCPPRVLLRGLCLPMTSTWVHPVCYERVCVAHRLVFVLCFLYVIKCCLCRWVVHFWLFLRSSFLLIQSS